MHDTYIKIYQYISSNQLKTDVWPLLAAPHRTL